MRQKIITILLAIIALLGGGYYAVDQANDRVGGGSDAYLSSVVSGTSTVPICKQSIYEPSPTSTYIGEGLVEETWPWICSTSSTTGKPLEILSETARTGFEICQTANNSTTTIWLLKTTASSTISNALSTTTYANADTYQIGYESLDGQCLKTHEKGIIWGGKVFILGEGSAGAIRYTDFLQ